MWILLPPLKVAPKLILTVPLNVNAAPVAAVKFESTTKLPATDILLVAVFTPEPLTVKFENVPPVIL